MLGSNAGADNGSDRRVDIRTIHELTGFQRDLLYCIAGMDKPSGQTIRQELEEQTDREITHGRLYPNLDTLVNRELVTKGEIDRRTNYYTISDAGIEALREYHDWGTNRLS